MKDIVTALIGLLALAIAAVLVWEVLSAPDVRRWALWTTRCRRGRRCARLVTTQLDTDFSPGALLTIEYTCGACGTLYRTATIIGPDGSWVDGDRERVRA